MASQTTVADVIVLKKTKLGESDLILTCLASDGQQVRFVAKGARKPGGSFASRLELFSCVHILLVKGRSLDIVKEARLSKPYAGIRQSMEKSTAAAPMAEILTKISQDGLEVPKLYDMTLAAFDCLESCALGLENLVVAAYLLKVFAFSGFAPSLDSCVSCGSALSRQTIARFSFEEGGVVCSECKAHVPSIEYPQSLIDWLKALLYVRFAQIEELSASEGVSYEALRFCQSWAKAHVGISLKSLDFLMSFVAPLPQNVL